MFSNTLVRTSNLARLTAPEPKIPAKSWLLHTQFNPCSSFLHTVMSCVKRRCTIAIFRTKLRKSYIYLFIYLFTVLCIVLRSCRSPHGKVSSKWLTGEDLKEAVYSSPRHWAGMLLEGLRKTQKSCEGSWPSGQDSKRAPPEYQPEALPPHKHSMRWILTQRLWNTEKTRCHTTKHS